jgi:hypothetical protein
MALTTYKCPPQPAAGSGTFSNNLVGLQLVDGGGLTQANFQFTTNITQKQNRNFIIGSFSDPISLRSMNLENVEETRMILAKNYKVYPNYDLSEITNITMFGSLVKRISVSVEKIINYFPAALESKNLSSSFLTTETASNISFDPVENETYLEIPITALQNPFGIDFTTNATRNLSLRENPVSGLRNFTTQNLKYSLFIFDQEYRVVDYVQFQDGDTSLKLYVNGNPFSGQGISYDNFIVRPQDLYVNKVFSEDFDTVENFLLNRTVVPKYSSNFTVPIETEAGTYVYSDKIITFPLNGIWNLDIFTVKFTNYLNDLNSVAINLDEYKTNLIVRFLTAEAIKEFDTPDQKIQKVLQIYGRSFDETKQFIGALANMTSVHYNVQNDIPSQLLKNLAQTLGWTINISPITNDQLLNSVFINGSNQFTGLPQGQTPEELNYQFYRNLIMNSAFLFKSKGTRKSIETLLRMVGAPEAITEFNEHVYLADQKVNMSQFDSQFINLSGGTWVQNLPVLEIGNIFSIYGVQYTGYTTAQIIQNVTTTLIDYPVDIDGFPSMPLETESFFFQIGGGWFESTPQHRMPEEVDLTNSVFTGSNPNYQTQLLPFNYGQEYLDRYRQFPFMDLGFTLTKEIDNNKSWTPTEIGQRNSSDAGFNAYYQVQNEKFVLNVKNVDLFMNPGQGLLYDVWTMSRSYNYPIPEQGLFYQEPTFCNPYPNITYPIIGGIDWTVIDPKPQQKTFFEFAQTFWKNMINVRSRMYSNDGKTSGYPTLSSIYWKYLESEYAINVKNDNFTYKSLIEYVDGMGDYWIRLVEQMIPATTIWETGVRYENSIFHRQKFIWRRQRGCQLIPIECKPCKLINQIFSYDCPVLFTEIGLYPWNNSPNILSFGALLGQTLSNYGTQNGIDLFNDCNISTLQTQWYVDVRLNGVPIIVYEFFNGVGYSNPTLSVPTSQDWLDGLNTGLTNLIDFGLGFNIDTSNNILTIFNNNCLPDDVQYNFELNVGINFDILCN